MTVTVEDGPPSDGEGEGAGGSGYAGSSSVRSTMAGELWSVLATVRVPSRSPVAVGVKVMMTEQLEPGVRVVRVQGVVML